MISHKVNFGIDGRTADIASDGKSEIRGDDLVTMLREIRGGKFFTAPAEFEMCCRAQLQIIVTGSSCGFHEVFSLGRPRSQSRASLILKRCAQPIERLTPERFHCRGGFRVWQFAVRHYYLTLALTLLIKTDFEAGRYFVPGATD